MARAITTNCLALDRCTGGIQRIENAGSYNFRITEFHAQTFGEADDRELAGGVRARVRLTDVARNR